MVDMTHDGNNRRTGHEILFTVFFLMDGICDFSRYIFGREAEFFCHNVYCFGIKTLVDRHHDSEVHASGDHIVDGHVHHRSQVIGRNEFGKFEHAAFGFLVHGSLAGTFGTGLALLFTPFGAFLKSLVFGCKAGECFFYLL